MKLSRDEVLSVASLARLELDDELTEKLSTQITDILEYVNTLEKADTSDIPPTNHAITLSNVFREDIVTNGPGTENAVANAPEKEDGCFVVPKIIG